jgi:hypothetical protein
MNKQIKSCSKYPNQPHRFHYCNTRDQWRNWLITLMTPYWWAYTYFKVDKEKALYLLKPHETSIDCPYWVNRYGRNRKRIFGSRWRCLGRHIEPSIPRNSIERLTK